MANTLFEKIWDSHTVSNVMGKRWENHFYHFDVSASAFWIQFLGEITPADAFTSTK